MPVPLRQKNITWRIKRFSVWFFLNSLGCWGTCKKCHKWKNSASVYGNSVMPYSEWDDNFDEKNCRQWKEECYLTTRNSYWFFINPQAFTPRAIRQWFFLYTSLFKIISPKWRSQLNFLLIKGRCGLISIKI